MYTEFYRIKPEAEGTISRLNARVFKLQQAGADIVGVDREVSGGYLYVTIRFNMKDISKNPAEIQ